MYDAELITIFFSSTEVNKFLEGSIEEILGFVWELAETFLITPQKTMYGNSHSSAQDFILDWVREKLPHRDVKNFTTDWQDGVAICELVNAIQPNLIPKKLYSDKTNCEGNAKLGIQIAYDAFGIPQIISPYDVASLQLDELSILTYIALFCKYVSMENQKLQEPNHKETLTKQEKEDSACRVYGTGLKAGELGKVAEFVVELNGAKPTDITIAVECKPLKGEYREKPELSVKPLGKSTYVVKYLPTRPGEYVISILHRGAHILRSPFYLTVSDPKPAKSRSTSKFRNSETAGTSSTESLTSTGSQSSDSSISPEAVKSEKMDICPDSPHSRSSTLADQKYIPIPLNSAEGPGLLVGEVGRVGQFTVLTDNNTRGPLSVCISCPAVSIPVPYVKSEKKENYTEHSVMYIPTEPGAYEIYIKWGENPVKGSPYKVFINDVITKNGINENKQSNILRSENKREKGNICVYYSASCTKPKVRSDKTQLERFLREKGITERADYSPCVALDLDLNKAERDKIFETAGTRKTPMLFINNKYIGGFEDVLIMDKQGRFDALLN